MISDDPEKHIAAFDPDTLREMLRMYIVTVMTTDHQHTMFDVTIDSTGRPLGAVEKGMFEQMRKDESIYSDAFKTLPNHLFNQIEQAYLAHLPR